MFSQEDILEEFVESSQRGWRSFPSPDAILWQRLLRRRESVREAVAHWRLSNRRKIKAYSSEYCSRPEVKLRMKEYASTTEMKAYRAAYKRLWRARKVAEGLTENGLTENGLTENGRK